MHVSKCSRGKSVTKYRLTLVIRYYCPLQSKIPFQVYVVGPAFVIARNDFLKLHV